MESGSDNVSPPQNDPSKIGPMAEATNESNSVEMDDRVKTSRSKVLEHFKLIRKLKYRCEVCHAKNPTRTVTLQRPKDGSTNLFWCRLRAYHGRLHDEVKGIVQSERSVLDLLENMLSTKQYITGIKEDEEKEEITCMIVRGRLSLSFVESDGFRQAWKYRAQADIILHGRWAIKESAKHMYTQIKAVVKAKFTNVHCVSLTMDNWTSENNHHLLGITAHWIDGDWKLCEQVLSLQSTKAQYNKETMGRIVGEVLAEFDLQLKVATVTTDNASTNKTMMQELTSIFEQVNP